MSALDKNTIKQSVEQILDGSLTCIEVANHYTEALAKSENDIGAWVAFKAATVEAQASHLDTLKKQGQPLGSLHGIPVGIKDIFDTADFPTCFGSPIHTGNQPTQDSRVIEKLKEAGAVIMGKTETTEFAFMHPSRTKNPHNLEYSPGGSSSGSAAAVAAGHTPLAVGSQTTGSVIRPASFCGVVGFKPTRGLISRRGVLQTSEILDHVGLFANTLEDIAILADAVTGYDSQDPSTSMTPKPNMLSGYYAPTDQAPSVVWIDMPYSDRYSDDADAEFEKLVAILGNKVERIPAPAHFEQLLACHKTIYDYEIIRCLNNEITNHWNDISDTAKPIFTAAKDRTEEEYLKALETRSSAIQWFEQFFNETDAVLTPSAVSEAPLMGSTGDPVCCAIWTLCGLPCITLPLLHGMNNLPIGVQVVGALNKDDTLLRTARYVMEQLPQ